MCPLCEGATLRPMSIRHNSRLVTILGDDESVQSPLRENRYATREDFLKAFDEDLNGLYQLSFLLTGDHQRAEKCFVAGIEDCAKANRVFKEWTRSWARRVIVEKALRELNPQRKHSGSSTIATVFSPNEQLSDPIGYFDVNSILGLPDFERFVFVLCVLERYRQQECALLLGCSSLEAREACTRALAQLSMWFLSGAKP